MLRIIPNSKEARSRNGYSHLERIDAGSAIGAEAVPESPRLDALQMERMTAPQLGVAPLVQADGADLSSQRQHALRLKSVGHTEGVQSFETQIVSLVLPTPPTHLSQLHHLQMALFVEVFKITKLGVRSH